MNNDQFRSTLKSLLNAAAAVQVRILELTEFEKQWKDIFVRLNEEFGADIKINIANQMLLNTFRYDKFHIVCDDLLSLIENEYQNEFSACRKAVSNLYIKSIKEYVEYEKSLPHNIVDFEQAQEDGQKNTQSDRALLEKIFATERRNAHLDSFHDIFGHGTSADEWREFLKSKLSTLANKIRGLRHLFSHRHQIRIQEKYSAKWDDLEIDNFVRWFNEFFSIVQKIAVICDGTHYHGMTAGFALTVSDQLDLILFGTIDHCIQLFCKERPETSYRKAREEFYASKEFAEIIVARRFREL